MATKAQINANRRNAQNSTGPRTQKGKAKASQNSLKHGLTARKPVINLEDQEEFEQYRDRLFAELSPSTPMETMLVERIVNLSWRLKRANLIQNQTIDALNTPDTDSPYAKLKKSFGMKDPDALHPELKLGYMAIKDFSNDRVLERLLMYERRMENSLYKTLFELERLTLVKQIDEKDVMPTKNNLRKSVSSMVT